MHRIVVIVANELTTDHAAGIDDDRRAQVDRGAVADDSDQRQPHQRLFAGAEAASQLAQSETSYRAALASVATLGRISLMDYLK